MHTSLLGQYKSTLKNFIKKQKQNYREKNMKTEKYIQK